MPERNKDLRACATAYDCREQLPELSSWMSDDMLRKLPIWKGTRFETGQVYFDLDNPDRGPFTATGEEGLPSDYTYVSMTETPPEVWALLITWRQPVSEGQGDAIAHRAQNLATPRERSAAGSYNPLPPP